MNYSMACSVHDPVFSMATGKGYGYFLARWSGLGSGVVSGLLPCSSAAPCLQLRWKWTEEQSRGHL